MALFTFSEGLCNLFSNAGRPRALTVARLHTRGSEKVSLSSLNTSTPVSASSFQIPAVSVLLPVSGQGTGGHGFGISGGDHTEGKEKARHHLQAHGGAVWINQKASANAVVDIACDEHDLANPCCTLIKASMESKIQKCVEEIAYMAMNHVLDHSDISGFVKLLTEEVVDLVFKRTLGYNRAKALAVVEEGFVDGTTEEVSNDEEEELQQHHLPLARNDAQGAAEPFVTHGLPPVQPLVSMTGNGGPMGTLRDPSNSTEEQTVSYIVGTGL